MAHPNRLAEIAGARGQTIKEMIDQELAAAGSIVGAARNIGVNTWTVARWIDLNEFDVSVEQTARLVKRDMPKLAAELP